MSCRSTGLDYASPAQELEDAAYARRAAEGLSPPGSPAHVDRADRLVSRSPRDSRRGPVADSGILPVIEGVHLPGPDAEVRVPTCPEAS